jgi:hypothetical protein
MKVKSCSRMTQTHNTRVKIIFEITEYRFTENIRLKTNLFSTKYINITHENKWWSHKQLFLARLVTVATLEKRLSNHPPIRSLRH